MKTMRVLAAMVCFVGCGVGWAQTQSVPTARATAENANTVTVPAGTVVPLTLVTLIRSKSTPVGDTVRASVAFPVTVGARLAIPEGVFVEGTLVQAHFPKGYKRPKGTPAVSPLKVHFTQLIYPNGYTARLDGEISAELVRPEVPGTESGTEVAALPTPRAHGPSGEAAFLEPTQQQLPTVSTPYAHAGPNPAVIYAPIIASAVVFGGVEWALHHRAEGMDFVEYDAGYQMSMTLTAPLTLDRSRIEKTADVGGSDAP